MSNENTQEQNRTTAIHVDGMFQNWFLDYASYVILERAVPSVDDGLKPVQRRILHAMYEMDDGRFHKVANVIGQTMQYHPHGDASIGEALVNIGQKELLFDTQGNWGDYRTGDSAAAPRYIEVRLSKFAKEVVFNPDITEWQMSYDGRKKEPVTLPIKFPLLLSQGADGIAVGLSTKILPHNFVELCEASINYLQGKRYRLLPDFPTGGFVDVSEYNKGERGGKVKIRARIEVVDKKTLAIREIPFGTTTGSLIESILKAQEKGKIKIKKVVDNTAKDVEVLIELAPGADPDVTVDALYAFTDCQISVSVNACVIVNDKPRFMNVHEILEYSTERTKSLLKRELEIKLNELNEKWHFSSLEKIFIEKRIYRNIEECETWEDVLDTIDKGLKPYKKHFRREITPDDIIRLTEIKIKRISRYDSLRADEEIKAIEEEIKKVSYHLEHLTEYAVAHFEDLIKKYGKGRERKTEVRGFEEIEVKQVAANNARLYVNRAEGFFGTGLRKDEFVCECSDLDDIIVFTRSGKMMVSRLGEKKFAGKDIIHIAVWRRNDERTAYNMAYYDGASKRTYVKRFHVTGVTRDKEYDLTQGAPGSKVLYFTANPNSESERVRVQLHPNCTARIKEFEFDFGTIEIKGRNANGNILTKYPVRKIELIEKGKSSIGGIPLWFDEKFGRLVTEEKEKTTYLGEFNTGDQIIVAYKNGEIELTNFELTNKYDTDELVAIEKFLPEKIYSAVYYDGDKKEFYVKRFQVELKTERYRTSIITEHPRSVLHIFTGKPEPWVKFNILKGKAKEKTEVEVKLSDIVDVKGWKALGNRLTPYEVSGKVYEVNKLPDEVEIGTTLELEVNPKSGLPGKQGELF
ncbi:MAG: DNA gyrase/topoisomerase IV subunit A [Chitinophagales bacterium]|nr:DNA gyrase/topoisomerase IV subunit A [Chitinophagales bacterium]MDW8419848.1 DNA gyrase/topoisomerase IV subunit A [Chitinophagales bacterium]